MTLLVAAELCCHCRSSLYGQEEKWERSLKAGLVCSAWRKLPGFFRKVFSLRNTRRWRAGGQIMALPTLRWHLLVCSPPQEDEIQLLSPVRGVDSHSYPTSFFSHLATRWIFNWLCPSLCSTGGRSLVPAVGLFPDLEKCVRYLHTTPETKS